MRITQKQESTSRVYILNVYDLHTHSHCSDGSLSPTELVMLAKTSGVNVLALTDHDTTKGISEARQAAGDDLTIIAGIEFSAQWRNRGVHIVGLNVDTESAILHSAIEHQSATRIERAYTIAERLEKVGIVGALEGAKHYANGAVIGRPHFAQYLVDQDYVSSHAQAFKKYLGAGKAGDVKQGWPDIEQVVQWIHQSGGIAVLAHPDKYDLTRTKLYELIADFVEVGGRGLEVVSGQQATNVTDKLVRAANDFDLLASCGSDFHAPGQAWQALGKTYVPDTCRPIWKAF